MSYSLFPVHHVPSVPRQAVCTRLVDRTRCKAWFVNLAAEVNHIVLDYDEQQAITSLCANKEEATAIAPDIPPEQQGQTDCELIIE